MCLFSPFPVSIIASLSYGCTMDLFNAHFLAGNPPAADFSECWQSGYNLLVENGGNYGPEMTWTESHSVSRLATSLAELQPLTWIFSPLKDFIMIGTRWEERETSGNICDQTQRMVKMGSCNTVNLCSHTFRHFSLQAKHSGSAAQRFSSDVQTHNSHKHSLFLSADAGTAEILLWRRPKGSRLSSTWWLWLQDMGHVINDVWGSTNQKEYAAALHQGWPHYGFTN